MIVVAIVDFLGRVMLGMMFTILFGFPIAKMASGRKVSEMTLAENWLISLFILTCLVILFHAIGSWIIRLITFFGG